MLELGTNLLHKVRASLQHKLHLSWEQLLRNPPRVPGYRGPADFETALNIHQGEEDEEDEEERKKERKKEREGWSWSWCTIRSKKMKDEVKSSKN